MWVLNFCEDTRLDEKTRSLLSGVEYTMMPFTHSIMGKRESFTRDRITKDILEVLIKNVLK